MGFFDYVKRGALAVGTGGLSETWNPNNYKKVADAAGVGGLLSPKTVDTSPISKEQAEQKAAAAQFAKERTGVAGGGGVQVNTQFVDPLRQQQQSAIGLLDTAARGTAPSAAELQAKQQAQTAAAQQFGIAAALQGRSPGAALNTATNGAAQIQGNAIANGAALRAGEMATARDQLTGALAGVRGQEQQLGTTNANLNLDQQKMLLAAQLQEQGYSAEMIKALIDAKTKEAASGNALTGGIIGTAGQLLPLALA